MKDQIIIQVNATQQVSHDEWKIKTPTLVISRDTPMSDVLAWMESVKCYNGPITEAKIILAETVNEPLNF